SFKESAGAPASASRTKACAPLTPSSCSEYRDDSRSAWTMRRSESSTSRAGACRGDVWAPIYLRYQSAAGRTSGGLQRTCAIGRYNPRAMTKEAGRAVLVVEDDVSVRRPLVKFLEMHGFAVATAETADEGLEALKKQKFTAAVVDLRLKR